MQELGLVLLTLAFGSAAIMKTREVQAFVEYLREPFGGYAQIIARIVVAFEGAVAVGFLTPVKEIAGASALCFLGAASAFLGWRLLTTGSIGCACWAAGKVRAPGSNDRSRHVLPAWYGVRNGSLALTVYIAALAPASATKGHINELVAVLSVCPALIGLGLITSIVYEHHKLNAREHPRQQFFAPRLAPIVALSWYSEKYQAKPGRPALEARSTKMDA